MHVPTPLLTLFNTALAPYGVFCGANFVRVMHGTVAELAKRQECSTESEPMAGGLAWWNIYGRAAWASLFSQSKGCHPCMAKVAALPGGAGRNSEILALKRLRSRSPRRDWPAAVADIAGSRCADGSWRYERHPDGSMILEFSKPIPIARGEAIVVPLRYRYPR
jgi:hypothetical protein